MYHSNSRYAAENSCPVCDKGGDHHEPWCIEANQNVLYAWSIIKDPGTMNDYDKVALHGMGIVWTTMCQGGCKND